MRDSQMIEQWKAALKLDLALHINAVCTLCFFGISCMALQGMKQN
jgi:hypothetical protein